MRIIFPLFLLLISLGSCKDESSDLGDQYFKKGEYQKAIDAYTEFLKYEPGHVKSLYNRGRAYEELKQYDKALQDFNEVIKKDPANANAYMSIASDYYYRQKDYENTVFYAEKALDADENNAVAYTLQGKGYQKLGKLQEALNAYNSAISVDKEYVDAYLSRGYLRIYQKQTSRACADFRVAASLGSDNANKLVKRFCR